MVRRWFWFPGLIAAVLLLGVALWPQAASAQEETVDLVAGCNPVALTYDDGTAIATVAAGVQPADALASIWKLLPAEGTWLGYSATAPQASNLQTVERLDAVFVCVSAAATITRPQIGGGG